MSLMRQCSKLAGLGLASCLFAGILTPLKSEAASFASLSEGAKLLSWSSQFSFNEIPVPLPVNGGVATARDNLLRPTKTPWVSNGETGFVFGNGDRNQKLTIDLGQVRQIDQIGADLVPYPGDREVWDYFEVRVSNDNVTYTPWGLIGNKDGKADITTSPLFINQPLQSVRYIEYGFGRHSFDYVPVSSGSRVLTLYANGPDEPPTSIPEPSAGLGILALGALGASSLLKRKQLPKA